VFRDTGEREIASEVGRLYERWMVEGSCAASPFIGRRRELGR
jgi:hypothetical protein